MNQQQLYRDAHPTLFLIRLGLGAAGIAIAVVLALVLTSLPDGDRDLEQAKDGLEAVTAVVFTFVPVALTVYDKVVPFIISVGGLLVSLALLYFSPGIPTFVPVLLGGVVALIVSFFGGGTHFIWR